MVKGYFHNRDALRSENPDYNRNAGLEFQYRSADGRFQTFAGYAGLEDELLEAERKMLHKDFPIEWFFK